MRISSVWGVAALATCMAGCRTVEHREASPFPNPAKLAGKAAGNTTLRKGALGEATADFGFILVPENRSDPRSRLIRLPFIRQRALEKATSEPVFLLSGGPGKTNLWVDLPPVFYRHNDLVRVGYRGVDADPKLTCPEIGKAFAASEPLSDDSLAAARRVLRDSFDRLVREGIDLNGYNMVEVGEDVEAVRRALGYPRINLFSTSYGTQVAHLYCRRHPATAHRSLMMGASNRGRHMIWEPDVVDRMLERWADLWRRDPEAAARTPDLLGTIRRVLETLPATWGPIALDRDKIRIAAFHMLQETESAAAVLDAFVAAANGDPSGLAVLSHGYDQDVQSPSKRYWGDSLCKMLSAGPSTERNYAAELDPEGSILGSPSSKLVWAAASAGGWPVSRIADEYLSLAPVETPTLIVNGEMDLSSPPEYALEMKPYLTNGTVVLLEGMGHMDVILLQREAFEHTVRRFFIDGVVDVSRYTPHTVDLTPEERLQDYARELFREAAAGDGGPR